MPASSSETIVRDLVESAGVTINGKNPWDIQIHDPRFYSRVLRESTVGFGEAYMEGWWDSPSVDELVCRLLLARLDKRVRGDWKIAAQSLLSRLFNQQSAARAYQVGERHYDLGNDLYQIMLDRWLNYTCAYWEKAQNLDEAQEAKLELVCKKIGLKPGMRVLELGCGWGSFAKYAAEKYEAEVFGVTVSKEQVSLGMELCRGLPVDLRLMDYREAEGQFDAVISIGIMEHVGYKNYRTYMEVVDRTLKKDGIAFIHTIGSNESVITGEPWSNKYIFPNGMLPSLAQLSKAMEHLFILEDLHNIGPHYDRTLLAWNENFEKGWPELKAKYDERFHRMWRYYLLSSAAGFRARTTQLWQIVMTHQGSSQPACRFI